MRPLRRTLLVTLLTLFATPLLAYTIYLKDGSRVVARDKYKAVNGKAIFTLESGTESFLPLDQIDVPRTDKANQSNYGTAQVLEDGKVRDYNKQAAPPPKKPTLSDFIAQRNAQPRDLSEIHPPAVKPPPQKEVQPASGKAASGYPDLMTLQRGPYQDLELGAEIRQLYRAQGVEELTVNRGTQANRAFIEITTNSEAALFRALEASARVLTQAHDRHAAKIGAFELLMMTSARERAGQFLLTPEQAAELTGKRMETSAFFVESVQF